MNRIDPQSWKERIVEFKEKTDAFYAGDMSKTYREHAKLYCAKLRLLLCQSIDFSESISCTFFT